MCRPKDKPKIQKLADKNANSQVAVRNQAKAGISQKGKAESSSSGSGSGAVDDEISQKGKAEGSSSGSGGKGSGGSGLADDFRIEYAKSARSKCGGCKTTIDNGSLRIGILTPSDKYDGANAN